jgi:hypothetical protein
MLEVEESKDQPSRVNRYSEVNYRAAVKGSLRQKKSELGETKNDINDFLA